MASHTGKRSIADIYLGTRCIRALTVCIRLFTLFNVRSHRVHCFPGLDVRTARSTSAHADRITRVAQGNLGDWKTVQGAVSELRIDYGPGYRVYFTRRGTKVILLLCGGDERTQAADIKRALKMAAALED